MNNTNMGNSFSIKNMFVLVSLVMLFDVSFILAEEAKPYFGRRSKALRLHYARHFETSFGRHPWKK